MSLLAKINSKKAKIGVIGMGYVGLPLALLLAKKGFSVTGFVRNEKRKRDFNKVFKGVEAITSPALAKQDIIIICVPTPIDKNKNPDLTDLTEVANQLSKINITGKLLINESTVAPFMTRKLFTRFSGKYFLTCSPERIDPGNRDKTTEYIPKVIGGIDKASLELGIALYKTILKGEIVPVASLETAEMAKMLENTYRTVNIALINEFAKLAENCEIDILEVIKAAKTKWSFQAHYPGIGVGGHCIPVDPYYVVALAKDRGVSLPVTQTALSENEEMPRFVAEKISKNYKSGMKVLVYGITYKKDVADLRESPVLVFCEYLKKKKIEFTVYDPLINRGEIRKQNLIPGILKFTDILVVGTDHSTLQDDYKKVVGENTIVIDGRNFFKKKVGKKVLGVGRNLV